MEEIYYLIHTTNNPDCINWSELRTDEFNIDDQFPGVYLSIITKDNINKEYIFPGKYIIILSKNLLLQQNYHINLTDYNGIVSEKNTFFPWNLDNFISKSNNLSSSETRTQSEIVFHDNIDMKYCCGIISILKKDTNIKINNFLPKISLENEEEPDMTKQPFLCYPFEDIYTGINPLPKSSNKWYEMMSKVCKINIDESNNTPEDIIRNIKEKANELYNHRDEQDINLLKQYTQSTIGGKNNKTKSKTKKQNKITKQNNKTTKRNLKRKNEI
jgi:hypothetical protein